MNRGLLGKPRGAPMRSGMFGWPQGVGLRNFPVDADRTTTVSAAAGSHAVNLPTGLAVGDMLIMFLGAASAATSFTYPSGWVELDPYNVSSAHAFGIAYRIVDGTEGATDTVTLGASAALNAIVYRVTGGELTKAPKFASGSATDQPTLAPGRGQAPFLWITIGWATGGTNAPSGLSNVTLINAGTINMGAGSRKLVTDSYDPGGALFTGGGHRRAYTLSVAPHGVPV